MVVNAVDNGDGENIHARRAKIALAGTIAGWGDEAMDFDARNQRLAIALRMLERSADVGIID